MAADNQAGQLVTVFGASGFVGRHTVRALANRGWRIRAAERRPDLAGHLQPMGRVGQIMPVQANLRFPDSIKHAVAGADAVVNLVAILAKSGRQTFDALHVEGARAVAEAARKAGVKSLILVSALGADPKSASNYARTKAAGEAAVLKEFPGAVILRPSVIFGPEDAFFNRFAAMAQTSPILPLIGGGRTRFQPVYVGDVAEAIAASLDGKAKPGTVYELGGAEILSFRQILEHVNTFAGRDKKLLGIPFWLAKLQALLTAPLPNALRALTLDQVRLLQADTVVSEKAQAEGRTLAGLGLAQPQTIPSIVPAYLERFKPKGQFAHYRG